MTFDDVKLIKHQSTNARQFGYWVHFRDQRPSSLSEGVKGKKSIIKFVESSLGPLGSRWQYQRFDVTDYILKLNNEHDLLILILKFR
jgi:hypothetical protein